MLDPLIAGIVFATVLLGLWMLYQGPASPTTWYFCSWFAMTVTSLLLIADSGRPWLSSSYVFYGSLAPGLSLGGTLRLLERPVPKWLLPGFAGFGIARFALLAAGLEAAAAGGAAVAAAAHLAAAGVIWRHLPRFRPNLALHVLAPAFALFGAVAIAATIMRIVFEPGAGSGLLLQSWLVAGAAMLGVQLWSVGERRSAGLRSSRDALEQVVSERTAALARSEERYRTVSELSSDFAFSLRIDPETGVRREWVTEAFERITGHPVEILDGHRYAALFEGRGTTAADEFQRLTTRDGQHGARFDIVRPDGEVRSLDVRFRHQADPETGATRVVGAARDVTEALAADVKRQELEREVEAARRVESLGMLTGGIAHDFNNLLAVILGNLRLAQDEQAEDSPVAPKLERVRRAAEDAARLTEQMLAYSGKAIVSLAPVRLAELLSDLRDPLQASLGPGCHLRFEIDDEGAIDGDAVRLAQVIVGLVSNSREALPAGRGQIVLRTGRDTFDAKQLARAPGAPSAGTGEYVWLEVTDEGSGMDEETRRRIFEPFFTTRFPGRGLGLTAALGIVRAHGGLLEVDSTPGVGTRIRILLPAAPPGGASLPADEPAAEAPGCVLVVDDDEAVLELAQEFLRRAGHPSRRATGGMEAIEVFQKHAAETDAVVLDLTMPDIDGREVFQALRRIRGDVPIVLATGYSQSVLEESFPDEEAVSFLRKPYEPEELIEAIRNARQSRTS